MQPQPGDPAEAPIRNMARGVLMAGSNAADQRALSEAPTAARTAIDNFKQQMATANTPLPANFGSKSLVGLIALIYTYLHKATIVGSYPKSLFPLLGITNFPAMFRMLPDDDKGFFIEDPQRFVDINLSAAGMAGTGATAFFVRPEMFQPPEIADRLRAITRNDWLSNIPRGTDRLGSVDLALGKFDRGEQVGQTHTLRPDKPNTKTEAPILELRRLAQSVSIDKWTNLSLDIFDFIVKFNDLKTEQFELRRHDPVGETKYK
jgi:hypothetical protein